ncbi:MAG: tetratricopeptide repeat protein [Thermoplasmata archaeon]|nr:tetratricopeptide repeat protein [Thermoplasmata archaeon]
MLKDIFVGREEEQERLETYFSEVLKGRGHAAFVPGPPGIGKTYLIEHIYRNIKNARLLQAKCNEDDQPYEALTKLLRRYMELDRHQLHGKEVESYAANVKRCKEIVMGLSSPHEGEGASGQQSLFASIEDVLHSIAKDIPLIIFIDDLQVSDASSLDFLSFLVDSIDSLPILLIGAYREDDLSEDHMLRILTIEEDDTTHLLALEPLNALDVLDMVEGMLEVDDLPTLFIKRLYKETRGNPLFVREVIRTIMEDQHIDRSDPKWYVNIDLASIPLPTSLKEIVVSQVRGLDTNSMAVLQYGASLGQTFSRSVLEKVLTQEGHMPASKVHSIISSLTASKLLREEDGSYKFEYPDLHSLVYNSIEDKESIHLALAITLEAMEAEVYSIAKQYSAAGNDEKTWVYQEKAGDQAMMSMAPLDASQHFTKSLEALSRISKGKKGKNAKQKERVRVLLKHGGVAHSLGEVDSALGSYSNALKLAKRTKDDILLAKTHRRLGDVHRTRNNWEKAEKEYNASLDIVEKKKKDDHGMAESLRGLGYVSWRRGEFDNAITIYSNALKYAEGTKDIPLVGVILIEFGNVYNEKGELNKALRYYLKSVDILTKTKEYSELARAYNNIGDTYLQMGQWKNAVSFFKKTGAVSEKIGNKSMMGWALFNAAEALAKGGDPDKAINYAEGALRILKRIGDGIGLSGAYKGYGIAYRMKKEWDKAEENFLESMKMGQAANSPFTLGEIYLEMGAFYHDKGDDKKAKEYLDNAEKIGKEIGAKILVERVKKEKETSGL